MTNDTYGAPPVGALTAIIGLETDARMANAALDKESAYRCGFNEAKLAAIAAMAAAPAPADDELRELLKEASANALASTAEDGISGMRLEYRRELVQRLDAAIDRLAGGTK